MGGKPQEFYISQQPSPELSKLCRGRGPGMRPRQRPAPWWPHRMSGSVRYPPTGGARPEPHSLSTWPFSSPRARQALEPQPTARGVWSPDGLGVLTPLPSVPLPSLLPVALASWIRIPPGAAASGRGLRGHGQLSSISLVWAAESGPDLQAENWEGPCPVWGWGMATHRSSPRLQGPGSRVTGARSPQLLKWDLPLFGKGVWGSESANRGSAFS